MRIKNYIDYFLFLFKVKLNVAFKVNLCVQAFCWLIHMQQKAHMRCIFFLFYCFLYFLLRLITQEWIQNFTNERMFGLD